MALSFSLVGDHSYVHSNIHILKYNPNIFDDQYIGCAEKMEEDIMPKVLQKEKANKQFKEAWTNATERWEEIKDDLKLPEGFEDEHGIALLTFTNQYPVGNPIHKQLNGNLTIAGASREDYMEKFHFKALHFYLTRALQILKPNCNVNQTTYRGSKDYFQIRPVFKFGRFTSSSSNILEAASFGTLSFFHITTCFGVTLGKLSFFPDEKEVLIPPTEKFLFYSQLSLEFFVASTGEMCSHYNCAYLGGEKREVAVCRSDLSESKEEAKGKEHRTAISAAEIEERMDALEDHMTKTFLYREHHQAQIKEMKETLNNKETEGFLLEEMAALDYRIQDLAVLVDPMLEREEEYRNVLRNHHQLLTSLQEELKKQRDLTALIVPLHERENSILSAVLHHGRLLTSLQEQIPRLRDLSSLIVPLRRREHSIRKSFLHHRRSLRSLQEELSRLQGSFVALITVVVLLGSIIICNFCRRFIIRV
ncbi:ecto-ADP-ribosyltransferase 5-like [Dendropsophus ebraccatus]|uniref:ecto-ADP-ribosyltransferase 5-like n=1 Tax=Dendropsophus ebraccatus TaxID=150705 RepID=UPI00383118EE